LAFYLTCAAVVTVLFSITLSNILIALALLMVLYRRVRFGESLRFPPVKLPLALFLLTTVISIALSGHSFREGWPGVRKFYLFIVLLLVTTTFRNRAQIRTFVLALAGVATLSSLWSFVQFARKLDQARALGADFRIWYTGGERITGFMSHWMTLSGEQMMVLALITSLLLFGREPARWRWALIVCGVVIAVSLVLGYTRSMWAGTALAVAYLIWLRDKRWLLLAPVPIALLLWINPAGVGGRIISIQKPAGDVDSNRFRAICRVTGMAMIKAHPWFGLGPQQIAPQFKNYIPAYVQRPLPPGAYIHLHNVYLQYAAERGIPALLAFLWWLGNMLHNLTHTRGRDWVVRGAIAVLIAVMAAGWYEHNLGDGEILTLFLGVMGCGHATIANDSDAK
jgi:putative inorganic carbon (HCO3(-)) transporter